MVGKTVMKLIVSWIEHKNGDKVIEIPKYFQAHLEWANFITWNSKPSLHSEGRGIDSLLPQPTETQKMTIGFPGSGD
jgi:hypothetical protein